MAELSRGDELGRLVLLVGGSVCFLARDGFRSSSDVHTHVLES